MLTNSYFGVVAFGRNGMEILVTYRDASIFLLSRLFFFNFFLPPWCSPQITQSDCFSQRTHDIPLARIVIFLWRYWISNYHALEIFPLTGFRLTSHSSLIMYGLDVNSSFEQGQFFSIPYVTTTVVHHLFWPGERLLHWASHDWRRELLDTCPTTRQRYY